MLHTIRAGTTKLCILALMVFQLAACHFDSSVVFSNDTFTWKMAIPNDCEQLTAKEIEDIRQQGAMLLGRASGTGDLRTQVEPLVWCLMEKQNMLSSNLVSMKTVSREQYVEDTHKVHELIKVVLEGQALPHRASSGEETIDGLVFETFAVELYAKNGQWIATQKQFRRFFGEQELTVTLSFSDKAKGERLSRVWQNSKFVVH